MTSPFGDPLASETIGNPVDDSGRPSSLGFWLGGLLVAGGIIGGVVWGVVNGIGFSDAIDDFERVPVGEVGTIELDEGDFVVYMGLFTSADVAHVDGRKSGEGREIVVESPA